jgi:hypothetical protein
MRSAATRQESARSKRFRIDDAKNRFPFWLDKFKSFEPGDDENDTANWIR